MRSRGFTEAEATQAMEDLLVANFVKGKGKGKSKGKRKRARATSIIGRSASGGWLI